ncbi:pepsin-like aspartyl protease [bacterium]|nr:pepsin-like aspartyl protease [bacterium]
MATVIPMRKAKSRWPQHHNRRRLHTGSSVLEGAAFTDYQAQVTLGSQTLELTIDSGSSTFAVAAAQTSADCANWYRGECSGTWVTNSYGSGSWSGRVCSSLPVSIGGLSAGEPVFVGILEQVGDFLNNCNPAYSGIVEEGIVGAAYPSLLSPPITQTLLGAVFATNALPPIFSMQCCGWDGATVGTGTLVIGGTNASFYTGELVYTNVTDQSYYCVQMVTPYSDGGSGNGCTSGNAIIDSGTSTIVLTSDAFDALMLPVATAMSTTTSALSEYTYGASRISGLPSITIEFEGGVSVTIPPIRYFQPMPGTGDDCYQLYVSVGDSNIIGQPLMEAYYTVFDQESHRVGFAPIAGCPPIPLSCSAAAAVVFPPSPPPAPPTFPPSACNACAGASTPRAEESECGAAGYCGWCEVTRQCLPDNGEGTGPAAGSCSDWIFETSQCPALGLVPPDPPDAPHAQRPPPSPPTPTPSASLCGEYTGTSCAACTADVDRIANNNCGWCGTSGRCVTGNQPPLCAGFAWRLADCDAPAPLPPAASPAPQPPASACAEYSGVSCIACVEDVDGVAGDECGWCPSSARCITGNEPSACSGFAFVATECPGNQGDGRLPVGAEAAIAGGCALLVSLAIRMILYFCRRRAAQQALLEHQGATELRVIQNKQSGDL